MNFLVGIGGYLSLQRFKVEVEFVVNELHLNRVEPRLKSVSVYMDRDAFYVGYRLMKIYFFINTNERSEDNVSSYEGRY